MPSTASTAAARPRLLRRLVLGTAFLLALAVALGPRTPPVHAQPSPPAAPGAPAPPKAPAGVAPPAKSNTRSATINIKADDRSVTIDASTPDKRDADAADADVDAEPDTSSGQVTGKGKHGKRVRVGVSSDDHEYDSFSDFVHTEPGLAFMVVSIVALVFLSPVLAIALILWYRMRKARMLNETMLRLAEKGVVPPAEALNALTNSNTPLAAAPSAAPILEQAKQIRRRAAWSDLRKGVILGGIGLGLTLYSMFDDGSPNGLGLVLFFVGVGYLVLWWYEERQFAPRGGGAGLPPTAPPSGGTDGKA